MNILRSSERRNLNRGTIGQLNGKKKKESLHGGQKNSPEILQVEKLYRLCPVILSNMILEPSVTRLLSKSVPKRRRCLQLHIFKLKHTLIHIHTHKQYTMR